MPVPGGRLLPSLPWPTRYVIAGMSVCPSTRRPAKSARIVTALLQAERPGGRAGPAVVPAAPLSGSPRASPPVPKRRFLPLLGLKAGDLLVGERVAQLLNESLHPRPRVAVAAEQAVPSAVPLVRRLRLGRAGRRSYHVVLPGALVGVEGEAERQPLAHQVHDLRRAEKVVGGDRDPLRLGDHGELLKGGFDLGGDRAWPDEADDRVGGALSVRRDWDEEDRHGVLRAAQHLLVNFLAVTAQVGLDVDGELRLGRTQRGERFFAPEPRQLQRYGQAIADRRLIAELVEEDVLKVEQHCLGLGGDLEVEGRQVAVGDLVAHAQEEVEVGPDASRSPVVSADGTRRQLARVENLGAPIDQHLVAVGVAYVVVDAVAL